MRLCQLEILVDICVRVTFDIDSQIVVMDIITSLIPLEVNLQAIILRFVQDEMIDLHTIALLRQCNASILLTSDNRASRDPLAAILGQALILFW